MAGAVSLYRTARDRYENLGDPKWWLNRRQFAGQEGGMTPRERQRRDWLLHLQVTGPPIKPRGFPYLERCFS